MIILYNKNMFSIIIPIYNTEPNLVNRLLISIRKQKLNHLCEILLIDDKSTEAKTINYLKHLKLRANEKILWNEKNIGLGPTRNIGIRKAAHEWLIFIDSDDNVTDDFLDCIYNKIKNTNNVDIISINFFYQYKNKIVKNDVLIELETAKIWFMTTWSLVIKKGFLLSNNCFNYDQNIIHEDAYFLLKMLSFNPKIELLDKSIYIYNKTCTNSITSINSKLNSYRTISNILNIFLEEKKIRDQSVCFKRYILQFWNYPIYCFLYDNKSINYKTFTYYLKPFRKVLIYNIFKNKPSFKKILIYIFYLRIFSWVLYTYLYIIKNKNKKLKKSC